jgi:DHA2 family multidrug resistance protein
MLNKGADPVTAHHQALRLLDREVMRQATMLAYNHIFFLITGLFAISIPLIFLLKNGRTYQ